ncbi:hypothetical protein Tco_0284906 [Tanacetum coccineum]
MQEAVGVVVQLKYDRIQEEAHVENQQFLNSIDEGMKKVIKEQVKNEVSKITPKIKNAPREKTTTTAGKTTTGSKTHKQSAPAEETMQSTDVFDAPAHQEFETEVYNATIRKIGLGQPEAAHIPHDLRKPLSLVPNSSRRLSAQFNVESSDSQLRQIRSLGNLTLGQKAKTILCICDHKGNQLVTLRMKRIIAVTKVEIVEWQNYKHLNWITVRRDDDILYKFKEGDFHRLWIQDIEDMLLLLMQGKLTNLSCEKY